VEGSGRGLILGYYLAFHWRDYGEPGNVSVRIFVVPAEIRTEYLPNTNKILYHLSQIARLLGGKYPVNEQCFKPTSYLSLHNKILKMLHVITATRCADNALPLLVAGSTNSAGRWFCQQ
jgi:hypothetical protein